MPCSATGGLLDGVAGASHLRPLMGVLLAVHAFVPVAALHAGLVAADHPLAKTAKFADRREQVLAGNERGLRLVATTGSLPRSGSASSAGSPGCTAHWWRGCPGPTSTRTRFRRV